MDSVAGGSTLEARRARGGVPYANVSAMARATGMIFAKIHESCSDLAFCSFGKLAFARLMRQTQFSLRMHSIGRRAAEVGLVRKMAGQRRVVAKERVLHNGCRERTDWKNL